MSVPVTRRPLMLAVRPAGAESEVAPPTAPTTPKGDPSPTKNVDAKTSLAHRRRAAGADALARSMRMPMLHIAAQAPPATSPTAAASHLPSELLAAPVARLRLGAVGPQVAQLQEALAALGYATGPIDGKFGPITEAALKAFQRDRGIVVDGYYGPQSQGALRNALGPHDFASPPSTVASHTPNADAKPEAVAPPQSGAGGAPSVTAPSVTGTNPAGADPRIAAMLDWAKSKQGAPYAAVNPFRFGEPPWDGGTHTSVNGSGTSWTYPAGTQVFDCSGFIVAAYRQLGVDLAAKGIASSSKMRSDTTFLQNIPQSDLKPGDLITYAPDAKGIGHVVLYLGEGKCIEASGGSGVVIRDVKWERADGFKRVPLPNA